MSDKKIKAALMFGPPGAGKGTVGTVLCKTGGHYHLSSGDVFRGLPKDSELGVLFHSYASKGALVPDDVTIRICMSHVDTLIANGDFKPAEQLLVLDGLPRTSGQAAEISKVVDVVGLISLAVKNDDELVQRLSKRAVIEGRADDADESIVRARLETYKTQTQAVLDFYPADLVHEINAEQTPIEVLRDTLVDCASFLK